MIRRHKTTIFTDAKESTTVYELKRIVEGILKRPPEEQILYKVRLDPSWPGCTAGSENFTVVITFNSRSIVSVQVFKSVHGFKKSNIFFSDRL